MTEPRAILEGLTVLPNAEGRRQVVIEGDRITEVIADPSLFQQPTVVLADDRFLAPGLIDAQINGGFGKEFKTDSDAIGHVTREIVKFGVTSILPTVTTKPLTSYRSHLADLMTHYAGPVPNARILGLHLEGPCLNDAKRGAHPTEHLKRPAGIDMDQYLTPDVSVVTLAPELVGGWQMTQALLDRGLRVGIGHSLAEYEDVVGNFDAERMNIVHTFNGMADLTGRNPGLIGVAMGNPHFFASVIADLVHVHPGSLRALWNSRGPHGDRLFAVSDGSAVLGLPIGDHQVGQRTIERRTDRAVLSGTETLVGSVLTMNVAARNIMRATDCPLWAAIRFASLSAAQYLGVDDEIGSIAPGRLADLCILTDDFEPAATIVGGELVFGEL